MLKKFAALLVSLLILCTLATAATEDYTGTWYLVSMEYAGTAYNPSDLGMEMVMILNDDGTGTVTMTDEEDMVATWVLEGETLTVTADDEPMAFTLTDDGQLVAENEGSVMYFGREAAAGFVAAAEIAAEDITAFDGTWNTTSVDAYGMVIPFSAMAQMGMEDGSVIIDNGSITAFGEAETEVGTFADGKLVVEYDDDTMLGKSISLLEDGTLAMTYADMIFYCEKVEIAE